MRILALDVGTGTQDILLFDTSGPVENCVKMVMPSATMIAANRIRRATSARQHVVITGVIQGGGPCHWALEDHLRAGLAAFSTLEAAATFDDDLDAVREMGIRIVSEDEARRRKGAHIELRDLDLTAIAAALRAFDVDAVVDGYAVGCLDHGASPPGYSDRLFRFDHLRRVLERENDLRAFTYLPSELPDYLTRARTLVRALPEGVPAVFLDTGPGAALGALLDPAVIGPGSPTAAGGSGVINHEERYILNLGNMHALAFHLRGTAIISLYEHHTGEMTDPQIEDFTQRLALGELMQEEVFESKGHGVYYASGEGSQGSRLSSLAVTGPQRGRLQGSKLNPYFAAPYGDMMLTGCFGMLRGFAYRFPEHAEEIEKALAV
jgi:uncharacterized protein (DUF1786 family)